MSQYLIISDLLKKEVGEGWQKHIIATTDKAKRQPDQNRQTGRLPHVRHPRRRRRPFQRADPRRSACPPRSAASISAAMLEGAAAMDERCKTDDVWKNPALLEAALQYIAIEEPPRERSGRHALCRQSEVYGGLVLPALGGKPGQERDPQGYGRQLRPNARQGAGRDGSAQPAAAVYRRAV